jgi:hypothetical protein
MDAINYQKNTKQLEAEHELEKVKFFGNHVYSLILEREKTIIVLTQLIVALLAISSFSETLVASSLLHWIKVIIFALLLLNPIMIWDYLFKLSEGTDVLLKTLGFQNKKQHWLTKVIGSTVYIYSGIITVVMDIIASFVVRNILVFLISLFVQVLLIAVLVFSREYARK